MDLVKEKQSVSDRKIIAAILKLKNQGQIQLENQVEKPNSKLITYLRSNKARWYWGILSVATITTIATFLIPEYLYPWAYIRQALGLVFALWLPGYSFVRILFPQQLPIKESKTYLELIERITLSFGMSLATVPIIGLLLNYTPWGVRLVPIILSLLILTLVFSTVAVIREKKLNSEASNNWQMNLPR